MRSQLLPLHEGLVISSHREDVAASFREGDTYDVLRMAAIRSGNTAISAWVTEQVDETVVVTGCKVLTVWGSSNGVNVSSVSARRVDTLS